MQCVVESMRWQMLGCYAGVLFFALSARLAHSLQKNKERASRQFRSVGLLAVSASALACILAPIPILPAPNGPYGVGTAQK